eukprot:4255576-Alexandrium_andersonii.AAC.1
MRPRHGARRRQCSRRRPRKRDVTEWPRGCPRHWGIAAMLLDIGVVAKARLGAGGLGSSQRRCVKEKAREGEAHR